MEMEDMKHDKKQQQDQLFNLNDKVNSAVDYLTKTTDRVQYDFHKKTESINELQEKL